MADSVAKNERARVHTHSLYESLIEETFGKKGVFGIGARDGATYFHTLSWRRASSFLADARQNMEAIARKLRVSKRKLAAFVSYLEHGIAAYTLDPQEKNLEQVLLEITDHGVSRSLS